MLKIMVYL